MYLYEATSSPTVKCRAATCHLQAPTAAHHWDENTHNIAVHLEAGVTRGTSPCDLSPHWARARKKASPDVGAAVAVAVGPAVTAAAGQRAAVARTPTVGDVLRGRAATPSAAAPTAARSSQAASSSWAARARTLVEVAHTRLVRSWASPRAPAGNTRPTSLRATPPGPAISA